MEKQRQEIQRELDKLSLRMEEILLELRTKTDMLSPDEGTERLKRLEFLEKVYEENREIPTWPFDWHIVIKLTAAEAIPILSFIGVGEPIFNVISTLVQSLTSP
jgi:hypothetical protein